jgi:hypothetical protein
MMRVTPFQLFELFYTFNARRFSPETEYFKSIKMMRYLSLRVQNVTSAQKVGETSLAKARQIEREHNDRLAKIKSELQIVHTKQKQLAEVRLESDKLSHCEVDFHYFCMHLFY